MKLVQNEDEKTTEANNNEFIEGNNTMMLNKLECNDLLNKSLSRNSSRILKSNSHKSKLNRRLSIDLENENNNTNQN